MSVTNGFLQCMGQGHKHEAHCDEAAWFSYKVLEINNIDLI